MHTHSLTHLYMLMHQLMYFKVNWICVWSIFSTWKCVVFGLENKVLCVCVCVERTRIHWCDTKNKLIGNEMRQKTQKKKKKHNKSNHKNGQREHNCISVLSILLSVFVYFSQFHTHRALKDLLSARIDVICMEVVCKCCTHTQQNHTIAHMCIEWILYIGLSEVNESLFTDAPDKT